MLYILQETNEKIFNLDLNSLEISAKKKNIIRLKETHFRYEIKQTSMYFIFTVMLFQQPIPLTPEIQIINRQPVPRLTSTPNRKTSTPNNDGYQPAQFEVYFQKLAKLYLQ